jgi:peptidoglycan LD-endopeptidase LytH
MAFMDGKIHNFGYNPKAGDYGNVVITEHKIAGKKFWALYGHLDSESIRGKIQGQFFEKGEILGHFGSEEENGGWEPHLHFQLSLVKPETHDLPGVVSKEERKSALEKYPDPRLVLGPIY